MSLQQLMKRCYAISVEHGFWEGENDNPLVKIALMHSELSELTEAVRLSSARRSEQIPLFTLEEEEVADIAIRLFDYCGRYELRLEEAILAKCTYNESRPRMHGKRF